MAVQRADAFLLAQLRTQQEGVVSAVLAMAHRHRRPPHTARELAAMMSEGAQVPRFGRALAAVLDGD
jgi:transcription initiation factor TFIIIB Brf1 subunit/transcription initiation factor TFIIB